MLTFHLIANMATQQKCLVDDNKCSTDLIALEDCNAAMESHFAMLRQSPFTLSEEQTILLRAGINIPEDISNLSVCQWHRMKLGIGFRPL